MRVAVVHSFYSTKSPSGENEAVALQCDALSRSGHEVLLVARRTDADEKEPLYAGRAALRVATGRGHSPSRHLDRFQPDVVHVHNLFPNWATSWLSKWGARTIATMHNYRPICAAATLWRNGSACSECLDRTVLASLTHACYDGSHLKTLPLTIGTRRHGSQRAVVTQPARLIVLNDEAATQYRTLRPGDDIRTIPNFVPAEPAPGEFRAGDPWVYIGRLTQEKGILWLLDHWDASRRLDIIGAGPASPEVQQRAITSSGSIRYLGRQAHSSVIAALRNAQGLVIPSLWSEGIPTIALEALATGTPLVISDRVAAADRLTGTGAGAQFSPTRPDSLPEALRRVASHRREMHAAAVDLHRSDYSEDVWLSQINAVYAEVAGRHIAR